MQEKNIELSKSAIIQIIDELIDKGYFDLRARRRGSEEAIFAKFFYYSDIVLN